MVYIVSDVFYWTIEESMTLPMLSIKIIGGAIGTILVTL